MSLLAPLRRINSISYHLLLKCHRIRPPVNAFSTFRDNTIHRVENNVKRDSSDSENLVKQTINPVETEESELEEMFIAGPSLGKIEWSGPTRGGQRPGKIISCITLFT